MSVHEQVIPPGSQEAKRRFFQKAVFDVIRSWGHLRQGAEDIKAAEPGPVPMSVLFPGEKEPRVVQIRPRIEVTV
jgi:hypothetical protein